MNMFSHMVMTNSQKKDVVLELNVIGKISSIYDDIPYLSDDKNITLILPEDADGNLTVYKIVYNPDSGDQTS